MMLFVQTDGCEFARADTLGLRVLDRLFAPRIEHAHSRVESRREFLREIATCAVGGELRVCESGMDCDGVSYDGKIHIIEASSAAFDALQDRLSEWADGPYRLRILAPNEQVQYVSRDNTLEAFEDGHPYSVVARSPYDGDDRPL